MRLCCPIFCVGDGNIQLAAWVVSFSMCLTDWLYPCMCHEASCTWLGLLICVGLQAFIMIMYDQAVGWVDLQVAVEHVEHVKSFAALNLYKALKRHRRCCNCRGHIHCPCKHDKMAVTQLLSFPRALHHEFLYHD